MVGWATPHQPNMFRIRLARRLGYALSAQHVSDQDSRNFGAERWADKA